MEQYSTARTVASVAEVAGYIVASIGAAVGLITTRDAGLVQGVALALPIAIGGLALVAAAQIMRAQIDTAIHAARILSLLERQILEAEKLKPTVIKHHRGQAILRDASGVRVGTRAFPTVIEAERWLDADASKSPD